MSRHFSCASRRDAVGTVIISLGLDGSTYYAVEWIDPQDEDSMERVWQDLYQEIGMLVVAGGQLEETVLTLLLNLLGGPHWRRSGLVIDGYSANQMVERCERLAGIVLAGDLQTEVLVWLQDVRQIQIFRNNAVHAEWISKVLLDEGRSLGPAAITRKKVRGSELQTKVDAYTAGEIRVAAGRCAQADIDGTALIVELQGFAELERQQPRGDLAPWTRALPK